MHTRPRVELDGVTLADARGGEMIIAVFRYRTTSGLVLLIPESAETVVPWSGLRAASVDLVSGQVVIDLEPEFVSRNTWLRGAPRLVGHWIDRFKLEDSIDA